MTPLQEAIEIIDAINGCHGCLDNGSDDEREAVERLRAIADGRDPDPLTVTVDLDGTPTLVGWETTDAR